jgi:hypothetical protein
MDSAPSRRMSIRTLRNSSFVTEENQIFGERRWLIIAGRKKRMSLVGT